MQTLLLQRVIKNVCSRDLKGDQKPNVVAIQILNKFKVIREWYFKSSEVNKNPN